MPQALWFVGLLWFGFAVSMVSLRAFFGLLSGDTEGVQKLAGSPTLDEQIDDENREARS